MKSKRKLLDGPIHERIRVLRESRGMSQVDFATKIGVDRSVVCHWEKSVSRPAIDRLPIIAEVLGVTVLDLVRGEKAWSMYQQALEAAA